MGFFFFSYRKGVLKMLCEDSFHIYEFIDFTALGKNSYDASPEKC